MVGCAKEMGITEEATTDDVFSQVRKGEEGGLEGWPGVVKAVVSFTLKG